jgi:phosphopantothenoylcysteine decarboxylase / phosphopantothenate---cysteine ligase
MLTTAYPMDVDFTGRTIALGITGGIAAYKACDLIRELYRRGAKRVPVIMTPNASQFVSPLSLSMLSQEAVYSDPLALNAQGNPIHIQLAQEADALLILPCSANMLAKLAHGLADELLSTTALTCHQKPVLLAPAMNTRMWQHPATQANLAILNTFNKHHVVGPQSGLLACGEHGEGHLADQATILQALYKLLHPKANTLSPLKALVSAGGTTEAIDPVRHIGNRSSGKMGLALADQLYAMGANVTLLWANTNTGCPDRPYTVIPTSTVTAMQAALTRHFTDCNLLMMVAAVSDFKLDKPFSSKLKRHVDQATVLQLTAQPDLLASIGAIKQPHQIVVGFAAEDNASTLLTNAQHKLRHKQLDAIVVNDISRSDIGFEGDHNEVTVCFADPQYQPVQLPKASKTFIAQGILQHLLPLFGCIVNPSH